MDTLFGGAGRDDRTPEEREALRKSVVQGLEEAVGAKWVATDPLIMDTYAWQYVAEFATGTNYVARPLAVVLPGSTEEVSAVVKLCNHLGCQYKALSTGFGVWAGPIREDFVVQIDLRRMDSIVKIDTKNMYAVVEPYVTGNELQTEAMKEGLNTHIIGAGGQTSILASATAMMGQGWDGISLGFSDRNLLGVEWVMPDGEIAQLGSFEASGEYFSGDGPGFSLRGVMRGFAGTMGGLGVFTKCAVKLYPFYGPERVTVTGNSPNYYVEIPENHVAGLIVVSSWEDMAEIGYRISEAEIIDTIGRNAPSLISGVLTVDNNEFADLYRIPLFHEMYYSFMFAILGQDREDLAYRLKTLKKIVKERKGGLLVNGLSPDKPVWMLRLLAAVARHAGAKAVLRSVPGFLKLIWRDVKRYGLKKGSDYLAAMSYEAMLRSGMNMRGAFKYGGSFHTSMGALVSWDASVRGAKVGMQIKKRFIEEKVIFDDGADNAWGGLYEGGAYGHLEELAMYDPRDPYCRERIVDFILETNLASIDQVCGDPINGIGPFAHSIFSPACMDYDDWQQKIKAALDPANASESNMYTDPEFARNPPAALTEASQRVLRERTEIHVDEL